MPIRRGGRKPKKQAAPTPLAPRISAKERAAIRASRGEIPIVQCDWCGRILRSPVGESESWTPELTAWLEADTGHKLKGTFHKAPYSEHDYYHHYKDEQVSGGICADCSERVMAPYLMRMSPEQAEAARRRLRGEETPDAVKYGPTPEPTPEQAQDMRDMFTIVPPREPDEGGEE